jgi:hypothetical protein
LTDCCWSADRIGESADDLSSDIRDLRSIWPADGRKTAANHCHDELCRAASAIMTGSITATVAVSALTSAIVSLVTFVIGVRISKDQGDRPVLRTLYQRLFEHFTELRRAIEDGTPKAWSNFTQKDNEFVPPFRAMQQSGEANLLPPELGQECDKVEREALAAGSRLKRWLEETYIPDIRGYLTVLVPAGKKAIERGTYRELRASQLSSFSEDGLESFIAEVERGGLGIGFEFATERGRTERWFLFPEYVPDGNWASILKESWRRGQTGAEAVKLHADLRIAAADLDGLIAALKARIRDPHPLMESVRRSLSDAIRGR